MTTLTDRPTVAALHRDERPVARLVVLDLDSGRLFRALLDQQDIGQRIAMRVLAALEEAGEQVEQAEPETAGYTEPDTGAFIGSRRTRYVGTWEEA